MAAPLGEKNYTAVLKWVGQYGLPRNYVAVDSETSGLDTDIDRVIQLGWCEVEDGQTVGNFSVVVDWTAVLDRSALNALSDRLFKTKAHMASKGQDYPWTIELMRKRGLHPKEVVRRFTNAYNGKALAAHYGWRLDYPLIGRLVSEYGGTFDPCHTDLVDTGLMAKAFFLGNGPRQNEDYRQYLVRLEAVFPAPRHSLAACIEQFRLAEFGVSNKHTHDASYDSWIVALLVERMRDLVEKGWKNIR